MTQPKTLHKTVVIDVVALTRDLITKSQTPFLYSYTLTPQHPKPILSDISPVFPAVTLSAQTTYLTGKHPNVHKIQSNYLFDKDFGEFRNWHQSSNLVKSPRLYERVKRLDPNASTFSSFFWFPMGDRFIDYAITPKPQYLANNGKLNDIWTKPEDLRHLVQDRLGVFPLHRFWGPGAGIESSTWIVDATLMVDRLYNPTFSTVYLPHLDYALQHTSTDPTHPVIQKALRDIDQQVRRLVDYYSRHKDTPYIIILSEYGIQPVQRTVHINQILRSAGLLRVRKENGGEVIDCHASTAFALADHQIANVYINKPKYMHSCDDDDIQQYKNLVSNVQSILKNVPGIKSVSIPTTNHDCDGSRDVDLVAVADHDAWFTYYYWTHESGIPDFAYTINIHRKPGYDPCEMYFAYSNPILGWMYLVIKLILVYVLHVRTIVDGTRFDVDRVKGSHGATSGLSRKYWPVFITKASHLSVGDLNNNEIQVEQVFDLIFAHLADTPYKVIPEYK